MSTETSFDPAKANGQRVLSSLPVRSPACPYVIPLPAQMKCKVPDPYTNPSYTKCTRTYENELLKRQSTVGDVQFFAEDLTDHVMCRSVRMLSLYPPPLAPLSLPRSCQQRDAFHI